jgi:hypothetical protein
MKAERVILSFIAILVGLFAAGVAFYLYQSTKSLPAQSAKPIAIAKPTSAVTPMLEDSSFLTIDQPKDEEVFNKKTISINGKTVSGATVLVSTDDGDQVVEPAANGSFSLTATIPDGTSILRITSALPTGEEKTLTKVVTFSTENF